MAEVSSATRLAEGLGSATNTAHLQSTLAKERYNHLVAKFSVTQLRRLCNMQAIHICSSLHTIAATKVSLLATDKHNKLVPEGFLLYFQDTLSISPSLLLPDCLDCLYPTS